MIKLHKKIKKSDKLAKHRERETCKHMNIRKVKFCSIDN